MYYLSSCNRGLFKSYYCYVLFLPFDKSFKYYIKKINSISAYSPKTIFLLIIMRSKCLKKIINLYFLTSWKMTKFFPQKFVIFNMITDYFLAEKQGRLECERRYVCQILLNLDIRESIRLGTFQVAYKWRIRVSLSHFLPNIFIETSDDSF